jgi:hypothetical protein
MEAAVMAVEAEDLMAAEVEASTVAEARIVVALEKLVKVAPTARDLMAEEVTAEAADLKLAAIWAHPRRDRRLVRRIFGRRI